MKTFDLVTMLRRLQAIFRRRFMLLLLPMLILAPGGMVIYKLLPRKYKSNTKILLAEPKTQKNLLLRFDTSNRTNQRINLLINVVMSQKVLGELAKYIAKQEGKTLSRRDLYEWVEGLRSQITIWNMGQGLVQLSYTCRKPNECVDHLQYLFKLFMKESVRPQQEAIQQSASFLSKQLERLRRRLQKSEQALTAFKRKHSLELPKTFQANLNNYIALRKRLFQEQMDLAAVTRRRDFLRKQLMQLDPALVRVRRQLINMLEIKIKLANYRSRYTRRHPLVRRTQKKLANIQRSIVKHRLRKLKTLRELERTIRAMRLPPRGKQNGDKTDDGTHPRSVFERYQETELRIEVLKRQIKENRAQLQNLKSQLSEYPLREQQLNELTRDAEIARNVYAKVRTLHEQSLLQRELDVFDASRRVRVIEPASRPLYPIAPRFVIVVGGAIFAALALSGLLIALAELFDPTLIDEDEVTQILGVEVIGEVHELPAIEL